MGVGDVDLAASAGFCIGTAPVQARPSVPLSQAAAAAAAARASDMANSGRSPRSVSPGRAAVSSPRGLLQQQQYQPSSPLAQPQQQQPDGQASACSMGDFSPRTGGGEIGGSGETLGRNALFSKYKHSVPEGRRQSEQVRAQQQQVNELKQQIKVSLHMQRVLTVTLCWSRWQGAFSEIADIGWSEMIVAMQHCSSALFQIIVLDTVVCIRLRCSSRNNLACAFTGSWLPS